MSFVAAAVISAGANLIGGAMQGSAARSAARTQAQSAAEARAMIERALGQISEMNAPYRETGQMGLSRINEMLPYFSAPVSEQDIRNMPGYNFMVNQGIGAQRQRFNVGGGGSNMDRAAAKFASDYTTGVALPALMQQKQDIFSRLAGIANIGQTAVGQQAQALGAGTGAIANLTTGAGSALAAGQIGSANALAGGLGGAGNSLWLYQLLNRGQGGGGGGTPGIKIPNPTQADLFRP